MKKVVVSLILVCGYAFGSAVIGLPTKTIDYAHNKIHQGKAFQYEYFVSQSANASSITYVIYHPTKQLHMQIVTESSGASSFSLSEAPTVGTNGTAVTLYGFNRGSIDAVASTSGAYLTRNPASTGGTELVRWLVGSGTSVPTRTNGTARTTDEWILRPNVKYMLRLTNQSGGAADLEIGISFYEE